MGVQIMIFVYILQIYMHIQIIHIYTNPKHKT